MRIRLGDGIVIDTRQFKFMGADVDRHDNVRAFVRRHGRKRRIRDWSSLVAFIAEYRRLLDAPAEPVKGKAPAPTSMRWLVERFYTSGEFSMMEASTRRTRRRMLDAFTGKHGTKPYAQLERAHIYAFRDEKVTAGAPEAGNNLVKALRSLFAWAIDAGHAKDNPARDVKRINTGSTGHHTWTVEEVHQFEARHLVGTKARLAFALMIYTGVRASDAIRLGRQMEQDGRLRFTEFKDRNRHPKARAIPILPELQAIIDATPSGNLNYLVTEFGRPYATAKSFGNYFKRQCESAGLPHCSAHGLRKAGATIAAERGASAHALMAIYGWTTLKQAEGYTRAADQQRLADEHMHLIVPERKEHESVPLSAAVDTGGTKRGKKT